MSGRARASRRGRAGSDAQASSRTRSNARASGHVETEWQLDATVAEDLTRVERWVRARRRGGALKVGRASTETLVDTYYESADWRVHQAGYALRVRRRARRVEATLKGLGAGERGGKVRRREITEPLTAADVKTLDRSRGSVGGRLRAIVGRMPLRRLFEVHTRRRILPLYAGRRCAAEVALDVTHIRRGSRAPLQHLVRVEIEVDRGPVATVARFVAALRAACGLVPARRSKYEHGLVASGWAPPPVPCRAVPDRTRPRAAPGATTPAAAIATPTAAPPIRARDSSAKVVPRPARPRR